MFLQYACTAQLLNFYHDLGSASAFLPTPLDVHNIFNCLEYSEGLKDYIYVDHNQIPQDFVSKSADTISADAHSLYAAIKEATVTKRVNGALAGILAECAAGSVGAFLSRKASIAMIEIDGKKRDSLETKMKFTGAYFGANFLTRGISAVALFSEYYH